MKGDHMRRMKIRVESCFPRTPSFKSILKFPSGAGLAAFLFCSSIQLFEATDAKATAETLLSFEGQAGAVRPY